MSCQLESDINEMSSKLESETNKRRQLENEINEKRQLKSEINEMSCHLVV